ncbi:MAG: DUF721 domain-containing protein [Candidatus Kapabacteria bacterium]|nr:DUF721 domain-containing protein [Candidatus Kapabacteria bacterium]MCS7169646.1 DUF721 domain-containing protein [Candidatus Kapabacteria bacterium]MDW7996391.1 DciA family protein [Bacteroidota bacterium]MDW8224873.1 DciA family protein [Bacteroidota bacterium]
METEPRQLGELIRQFLREQGMEELLWSARLPQIWANVVGNPAARVSHIRSFTQGELVVEVTVPAWRVELRLRAEELRRRLNEQLGAEYVRKLVIR